jgi:hypothetical protein
LSQANQAPLPEDRKRADGLIASPEEGWPQWRGPKRDGVSNEKGFLPSDGYRFRMWNKNGPGNDSNPAIGTDYAVNAMVLRTDNKVRFAHRIARS